MPSAFCLHFAQKEYRFIVQNDYFVIFVLRFAIDLIYN